MTAFRSSIFWRAFFSLVLGLLAWVPIFFALTVPVVNRLAYEVEETAARNVLDNVVQSVRQSSGEIAAWRQSALEFHKQEMRSVVATAEGWARQLQRAVAAGEMSPAQARKQFFEGVRHLRFGNGSYLWVADSKSYVHVHPDPQIDRHDASVLRDSKGALVFAPMVEEAVANHEGFATNWWRRMDTWLEEEQLSYFNYFPEWDLVIGTGVYLDDIRAEVARRKAALVQEVRHTLHGVRLPHNGFVFVIDGAKEVVVHPDPTIENNSMLLSEIRARAGGLDLAQAIIDASGRTDGKLTYRFAPSAQATEGDYQKVAWVRHVPEFDWYLGATVYLKDLGSSGDYLASRMALAFVIGLAITMVAAFFFLRSLTRPILDLAGVAKRQAAGDLDAVAAEGRKDELGVLAASFNAMVRRLRGQIDELAQRTAEVSASEARFRGLVEQSLAGIFVIQQDRFRYINQAMAGMFGYDDVEAMARECTPAKLVPMSQRDVIEAMKARILSDAASGDDRELVALKRDGSVFDIEVSGRMVEFEGKPAIIGVVLDITERRRAERARQDALEAAEHLSRLKSDFIANMSHEFRTPLNIIMGMSHIGQRAKNLEKAQDACGQILGQSRRLLELVTQLLDFSSIETGQIDLKNADADLGETLRAVATAFGPAAAGKGLELRVEVAPGLPAHCCCDEARVRRILGVFTENAIKFTAAGSIVLSASRERDSIALRVRDTGVGMDDETLKKLFRPFVQGDGTATRQFGGMGLSLALAERLALHMGGVVEAQSDPGQGSVLTLRIPCNESATAGA